MPNSTDFVHFDDQTDRITKLVNEVVEVVEHLSLPGRVNGLLKLGMLARLGKCFIKAAQSILRADDFVMVHVQLRRADECCADSNSRQRVALPVTDLLHSVKVLRRLGDNEPLRFTEEEVLRYLGLSEKPESEVRSA